MLRKHLFIQSLVILLFLNNAQGENKPSEDELDRLTIGRTGCKLVSLAGGESVTFTRNATTFTHLPLVPTEGEDEPRPDPHTPANFPFAIRSDEDVEVFLTSKERLKQYLDTPEFKFEFGVNGNDYTKISAPTRRSRINKQRYTPSLLSAQEYKNFFISLHSYYLRTGQECEPFVIFSNYGTYYKDIALIGFAAKSKNGAKILYDCPANFVDCNCKDDK